MFVAHELRDTLRVDPSQFGREKIAVLTRLIDAKYANKVVPNVGLCVCLKEFVSIGDSYIFPGDGGCHTDIVFLMVVFRPHKGEVLEGVVNLCCKEFLRVSVDFFHDIYIEPQHLHSPSRWNEEERTWIWEYAYADSQEDAQDAEEQDEEAGFYLRSDSRIRFKIESVRFRPVYVDESSERLLSSRERVQSISLPAGLTASDSLSQLPQQAQGRQRSMSTSSAIMTPLEDNTLLPGSKQKGPMLVMASCAENGLGACEWWEDDEVAEE